MPTTHYGMPQDTTQHWGQSTKHQIAPEQSQVPPRPYLCQGTAPDALPPNSSSQAGQDEPASGSAWKKIQITPNPFCSPLQNDGQGQQAAVITTHPTPTHTASAWPEEQGVAGP